MPSRLRLYDCRNSRLPRVLGLCQDNVPAIAEAVNGAERRLIYCKEARSEGWNGTWAEIAFNVSREQPYITLPRNIARLEAATACTYPIPVHNSFYSYLRFGNGRLPKTWPCLSRVCFQQAFARNNAVTFTDLSNAPQYLAVFPTDLQDVGKRVLIQGVDKNGSVVYTQDGLNQVQGVFVSLEAPFVMTPIQFSQITGIQKDMTVAPVQIFQSDPNTADQVLLLTMEPSELVASYRRYYLDSLPNNCCGNPIVPGQVQVLAMAKLEPIPVMIDVDYLLLTNLEAIIYECQSIRMSEIDTPAAQQMSANFHMQAVRLLIGELTHTQGLDDVAVNFAPFGSARLERLNLAMI